MHSTPPSALGYRSSSVVAVLNNELMLASLTTFQTCCADATSRTTRGTLGSHGRLSALVWRRRLPRKVGINQCCAHSYR
eukprot:5920698-Pleurochrysis_carterae.AAC.1